MCNTIARPGKDPIRLGRTRSAREGPGMIPTGNPAPPEPRGNHRPAKRRAPRPVTTRPSPSATPLHPPLHEEMERSEGRRGVADTGRVRKIAGRPARSSLNPRERLLGVRARGLSDDLAG